MNRAIIYSAIVGFILGALSFLSGPSLFGILAFPPMILLTSLGVADNIGFFTESIRFTYIFWLAVLWVGVFWSFVFGGMASLFFKS
ncbi:MAG: hypothetical protein QM526_00965 [Alphaproteobacteria bacterium]|nr:hypothetical protein [Alphaproteobacteria bacterium]